MAQANAAAAAGRPSVGKVLSPEDRANLKNYHVNQVLEAVLKLEELQAPVVAQRDEITSRVNQAKADMGKRMTRQRLMRMVNKRRARGRDLILEEEELAEDNIDCGFPLYGQQAELFPSTSKAPVETRDELTWDADGYLAGRRAAERKPPEDCPQRFGQAWMKGYDRGQQANLEAFAAAQKVREERTKPDPEAGTQPDDGKGDADLDPQTIEAQARKLRGAGFLDGAKGRSKGAKGKPNLAVVNGGAGASAPSAPAE